jgi:hypothetical protein
MASLTYLAFGAPRPVAGRKADRTEAVQGDAEHGVDRTQARCVVQ